MIEPILVFGIPVDFILFALTLLGCRAIPSSRRFRSRSPALPRSSSTSWSSPDSRTAPASAGLGDHMAHEWVRIEQSVPSADGLCAAVAPFRGKPDSGRDAGTAAGRLEGRRRAARPGVRAVELPRQHRRRADRRDRRAARVPGQGSHRLSRRDRRGLERRRLRQRRRRHHHDHDVDRRRQSARGRGGLYRRRRRDADLCRAGLHSAAALLADPEGSVERPEDRSGAGLHRCRHSDRRTGREHHRQCEIPGACSIPFPFSASPSGRSFC